jgi:hypothetical protein
MKRYILIPVFLLSLVYVNGQTYFEEKYKSEAAEVLEVLSRAVDSSNVFKTHLKKSTKNYRAYAYYAPDEASKIFDIILEEIHPFKHQYFDFVLKNYDIFTGEQMERVKHELKEILDKYDKEFYSIVSYFHLDEYKNEIVNETEVNYYGKLRKLFIHNGEIPSNVLSEVVKYTTLANLGDISIEDSLVNLVNDLHYTIKNFQNGFGKKRRYYELYINVVPKILSRLNSKRSVAATINLLLDDYDHKIQYYADVGVNSLRYYYVTAVIFPKISRYEIGGIELKFYEVFGEGQKGEREYYEWLYNKIKNNQVTWKKTLIDVD